MLGDLLDAEMPSDPDDGDPPDFEDALEDLNARVPLPYALDLCIDLWYAWTEKGIMPLPGGYLAQPRQWQKLIHLLNGRKNKVIETRAAHKREDDYLRGTVGAS